MSNPTLSPKLKINCQLLRKDGAPGKKDGESECLPPSEWNRTGSGIRAGFGRFGTIAAKVPDVTEMKDPTQVVLKQGQ
jgi:hypothetical protein